MGKNMNWQAVPKPTESCASTFSIMRKGIKKPAFAICFKAKFYAYENICPHLGTTLDWVEGQFFSEEGQWLMCQTHGALFKPNDGSCISGPCPHGLQALPVRVDNDCLWVQQSS